MESGLLKIEFQYKPKSILLVLFQIADVANGGIKNIPLMLYSNVRMGDLVVSVQTKFRGKESLIACKHTAFAEAFTTSIYFCNNIII